jgi:hypothetical protein
MIDSDLLLRSLKSQLEELQPPERDHMLKYINHVRKDIERNST